MADVSEETLKVLKKAVIDAFKSRYANISSTLKGSLKTFAEKAYANDLITEPVKGAAVQCSHDRYNKNFADIMDNFVSLLDLGKSVEEVLKHYQRFIEILEELGGPAAIAGRELSTELTTLADFLDVVRLYNIQFNILIREIDDSLIIEISGSGHIDNYTEVGHGLNLSKDTMESIKKDKKNDKERKIGVLCAWKKKKCNTATYLELIKAFLKIKKTVVAEFVLKYLSKKREPQQSYDLVCDNLKPQKAYDNWDDMTESEKEAVRNKLMDENYDVREAYANFVSQLMDSLTDRKINPMTIPSIVQSFGHSEGSQEHPIVFEFHKDDSIAAVFFELSKHCSWFNYELFKVIVKIKGNEAEKQYLKTYEDDHLVPYLKRSIFEIPFSSTQTQCQRTHLAFKVSKDLCTTGREVKSIQRNLAKLLGFQNSALLNFENYKEGCIDFIFSLPKLVLDKRFPKSRVWTYLKWEQSRNCYKVDADLLTVLSHSEKPEVAILTKMLQDVVKLQTLSSSGAKEPSQKVLTPKSIPSPLTQHLRSPHTISQTKVMISPVIFQNPPKTMTTVQAQKVKSSQAPPKDDMMLSVNLENYRRKFKALLFYEEEEHVKILHVKCDGQYKLTAIHQQQIPSRKPNESYSMYAYLDGMSANQITYALQASSHAVITICDIPQVKFHAMFLNCNYRSATEKLYIGFNTTNESIFSDVLNAQVQFEVNHSYFKNLNAIISQISNEALKRIIPNQEDFSKGLDLRRIPKIRSSQLKLDKDQFRCLQTMLFSRSSAPVLIPGPFGSGKTRLLAVAAQEILRYSEEKKEDGHVLICCYQQDSADVFMNEYFLKQQGTLHDVEVIRVTTKQRLTNLKVDTCFVTVSDFKKYFHVYQSKKHVIFVTTCGLALWMSDVAKNYFTHILIDEGAQTREPETIAPLIMANKDTRIIIAGDVQQVGPKLVVLGDEPQQHGLGMSLLERLHEQYKEFGGSALEYVVSLNCNYRCHTELLNLSSTLFYDSSLVSYADNKCHPAFQYPLMFICSRFDSNIPTSPESLSEALIILDEVKELLKYEDWHIEDVCIMAASRNQANLIQREIFKSMVYDCLRGVKVCTSFQMQGLEYSLLFISTVESLELSGRPFDVLKSFCHPAVFNTAITRSQSLVVAVGNPLVLMMSEATIDQPKWCWREFLSRCMAKNTFMVSNNLENPNDKVRDQFQRILESRQTLETAALFHNEIELPTNPSLMLTTHSEITSASRVHTLTTNDIPPSKRALASEETEVKQCKQKKRNRKKSRKTKPKSDVFEYKMSDTTPTNFEPPLKEDIQEECKETKDQDETPALLPCMLKRQPSQSKKYKSIPPAMTIEDVLPSSFKNRTEAFQKPGQAHHKVNVPHESSYSKQKKVGDEESVKTKTNSMEVSSFSTIQTSPTSHVPPSNQDKLPVQELNKTSSKEHFVGSQKRRPKEITLEDVIPSFVVDFKAEAKKLSFQRPAINELQGKAFKHKHRALDKELLETPLDRKHYKKKFHQLLCREEEEHDKVLASRCDGEYSITIFPPNFVPEWLQYPHDQKHVQFGLISGGKLNGDRVLYAKQCSAERESVVLHLTNSKIKADIITGSTPKKRGVDVLLLAFTIGEISKLTKKNETELADPVFVSFTLKWSYFDNLHKAIDQLPLEVLNRIVPVCKDDFTHTSLSVKLCQPDSKLIQLDDCQMKALATIMNCDFRKSPVLVIGSFGTGKTRLLARAAWQILVDNCDSRVLICAHHQSSADSFINKYFGMMSREIWCFRVIPKESYKSRQEYKQYKSHYITANEICIQQPKKTRLVVTTLLTSLHLFDCIRRGDFPEFTHILLDEGAQTREPESIAPLCLANSRTKIVIVGDHKQVGPEVLVLGRLARQNDLKISLLERLHSTYTKELSGYSKKHRATLLTNYRCSHALLSLPSYLFYNSALVTEAKSSHSKALHFLCSSLNNDSLKVTASQNELEADILFKYLENYQQTHGWKPKSVCIIAATGNQKSYFSKELQHQYKHLASFVEVLPIYLIQGCEFEAVFLSTAEPITPEGVPTNTTKTPCSQSIFNTVLTRAESLVVCAGNPFLLMKIEKQYEHSCWKEYIRRCIISKTFHVPQIVSTNVESVEKSLKELQHKIFSTSDIISDAEEVTKDSILKSYQKALRDIPQYKKCKLQISQVQRESRWGIVEIKDNETKSSTSEEEAIECELSIINPRYAKAIPLDSSKHTKPIIINGFNHRKGAFDGDIVGVNVFYRNDNKEYGKVVCVKEARHPTKYVCKADQYNVIYFYPLDKSVPSIVNLPKISREHLEYHNDVCADYITVFKMSSLQSDHLPQIKELVPSDLAQNLLFVVQVLGWSPKYWKPLGAVIEVLPCTSNLFFTERLFRIVHDIDDTKEPDVSAAILQTSTLQHVGLHYDQAFTIDSPDSLVLDDAISLVPLQDKNTYKLAVLVTDVAKYISENDELDKFARKRGTSVYGGNNVVHMLPQDVAIQMFSLNYNTTRDVLAVTAIVVVKEEEITIVCNGPEKAHVTSQARLTYESAQNLLDAKPIEDDEINKCINDFDAKRKDMCMAKTLKLLLKITMHLQTNRLGCGVLDTDESKNDSWQSHLLVTELMIWANSKIAGYLSENLMKKGMALLRRQLPPLSENLAKFRELFKNTFDYSLALRKYSQSEKVQRKLLIIGDFLVQFLKNAYKNCDQKSIIWALSNDHLYPQLAQIHAELRKINQRSEYISAKLEEATDDCKHTFAHHSLQVDRYTHFTSPIRRYFDILVQRLVVALLDSADITTYTHKELQDICHYLNLKAKMAKRYEQSICRAVLAKNCENSLINTQAFVSESFKKVRNQVYQLYVPSDDFTSISDEDTQFEYSDLNINRCGNENELTWHIVCTSLDDSHPHDLLCDPQVSKFTDNPTSEKLSERYCFIEANIFLYDAKVSEEPNESKQMRHVKYKAPVNTNTIEVSSDVWDLAHQCLISPSLENISNFIEVLPDLPSQTRMNSDSLHIQFSNSPVVIYDITRTFQPNDVVNVWFGKSMKESLPSPELHLMEIAPTFRICVQHSQNPVKCFSGEHLQQASHDSYDSIYEYVELWSKVLVAEAAYDGINTRMIFLIKNACLKWPEFEPVYNCIDDVHYEPAGELTLKIPLTKLHIFDNHKIVSGDLVCARYDIVDDKKEALTAVFHFVITRKQKDFNTCCFFMKSMGNYCQVSEKWKSYLDQQLCEIQIIKMPVSFTRVFNCLLSHYHTEGSKLANEIAIGMNPSSFPRKVNIDQLYLHEDDFALKLWDTALTSLNSSQIKAIRLAIKNRFQLIQGPPGAHLIYIFSKMNAGSNKCVLYCCPSNKAVDVVHNQLNVLRKRRKLRIIRLYGRAHEKKDYPDPWHNKFKVEDHPEEKDTDSHYLPELSENELHLHKLMQQEKLQMKLEYKDLLEKDKDIPISIQQEEMGLEYADFIENEGIATISFQDGSYKKGYSFSHDLFKKTISGERTKQHDIDGRCLPELKDALHYKIRHNNPEIEKMRLEYKGLCDKNIIPSSTEQNRYKKAIKDTEYTELLSHNSYDVILCTCNETCSRRLRKLAEEGRIAQCIVDECGMASEPETIAAASLCDHVVLIGDHKQLQPVIKYHMARDCGLGKSLFERYAESRPKLMITLNTQYRMHEMICNPPSELFYNKILQTDKSIKEQPPLSDNIDQFWPSKSPIVVYDIVENSQPGDQHFSGKVDIHSKFNYNEALKVLDVIQELHNHYKVSYESMAVLTPYKAQKELIIKMMHSVLSLKAETTKLKVATITDSQGDQYDIVILTTVRSLPTEDIINPEVVQPDRKWMTDNLGFLTDAHQINVGITRAKYGLIIIGNTTLLKYDKTWKDLLEIYEGYGCIKYGTDLSKSQLNRLL